MENNVLVRFWVTRPMRDFHVTLGVVAVVAKVIGSISHIAVLPVIADVVTLFGILHYFIHGYFYRQQQFLINNMKTYSLPKKKIARTGGAYLGGFMLMVCMGMAFVREIYSGTLLKKLEVLFKYIIKTILDAIFGSDGLGKGEHVVQNNHDLIGTMNEIAAKEEAPWENLINAVQTVLIIVGVIILIAVVIALAINMIRNALNRAGFQVKKSTGKETSDREESLWNAPVQRDNPLDFSANARIRRTYRRKINRQRKKGQIVPEWMTPAEIESHVAIPDNAQYRQLHEIYEKARYSESGASEADARQIRKLDV